MSSPVLPTAKPVLPVIFVSEDEATSNLAQIESTGSLGLETEEPLWKASSMPESRPSGLVAIRFFNNAASPSIGVSAGTANTPTHPPAPPTALSPRSNSNVYLPMMPMPFVQRRSADDIPVRRAPVTQLLGVKRGRGRPRTRSIEQRDGMPPAHMMTILKPAPLIPRPPTIANPPELMAPHLGKLPRLAPRPNLSVTPAMIQPNTMQQTRNLMRSSIGAGLPNPALLPKSRPSPSARSFSADVHTPEMAVLRLISDACDIHESKQNSADLIPKPITAVQPEEELVTKSRGSRKLAPRLDASRALQLPDPQKPLDRSSSDNANQIRKLMPRPPSNKLPLPVAPRHRQP
jgi:hypothetical protein